MAFYDSTTNSLRLRQNGAWGTAITSAQSPTIVSSDSVLTFAQYFLISRSPLPINLTLPADPALGQTYKVIDGLGNASTSIVYVVGNGKAINGNDDEPEFERTDTIQNNPIKVATTSSGIRSFFTNSSSATVTMLHVGSPVTLNVGQAPRGIAIRPGDVFAYVCNSSPSSNSISVIQNVELGEPPIVVGSHSITSPWMIAITPNGLRAYVTNGFLDEDNVRVTVFTIDGGGFLIPLTFLDLTGQGYADEIAITSNGHYAYVTTQNGVTIIKNVTTGTPEILMHLPLDTDDDGARGLAITPNGNYAYVGSGSTSGNISVIQDVSTEEPSVLRMLSLNSSLGLAVTPNGQYLYISNSFSNSITVMTHASTGDPIYLKEIVVGAANSRPYGIAVNPSGYYTWICNSNTNTVTRLTNSSGAVIELINANYGGADLVYNGIDWSAFTLAPRPA